MNDITKARYFLQAKGSKLKDLTSFGLMFATAERHYRDLRLQQQGASGERVKVDPIEVDALLEYGALRHLKRYNQLPKTAKEALAEGTTLKRQRELALSWINA